MKRVSFPYDTRIFDNIEWQPVGEGFTPSPTSFIINYDIKYRMGQEAGDEE